MSTKPEQDAPEVTALVTASEPIRSAEEYDRDWIEALWKKCGVFGNFHWPWSAYMDKWKGQWRVVPGGGFARWRHYKGKTTLYDIAVDPSCRRMGIASRLIEEMPAPIVLKTDADNTAAQAFYERLGFRCMGTTKTKKGKEQIEYAKLS